MLLAAEPGLRAGKQCMSKLLQWQYIYQKAHWGLFDHRRAFGMGGRGKGDPLKGSFRLLLIIILLAAPLCLATPAAAQEQGGEGALSISAPETDSFPTVRFRMEAYDKKGNFIDALTTENVQVVEDGQLIQPQSLKQTQNGLQVILAVNTSPALANKTKNTSLYQTIQKTLVAWAQARPAKSQDDYSLSTPTGLLVNHEKDPAKLIKAINDYQPDLAKAQSSLGSLAEALDVTTEPATQPGMKRAILYITPALPANSSATLADLNDRAKRTGVKIFVWQVATKASEAGTSLQKLAESTGGKFQLLQAGDPMPEIEALLQPMRQLYQVQYISSVRKSGAHNVGVQVSQSGQNLVSKTSSYNLTIQAPNPIFLSPPASVQRNWVTPTSGKDNMLSPDSVDLQILIEYPDQHQRALKATRLFVDGKLVQENTAEPFDHFTWPISSITTATRQTLRIEVEDELGLKGSSIETPIEIAIDQPAKASLYDRISESGIIALASVITAGSGLMLVLVLTSNRRRKRQKVDKKRLKDPLTQPVTIRQEEARASKNAASKERPSVPRPALQNAWQNAAVWPRPSVANAPARLVALDENEQPITGGVIPLSRQEITFGTDPRRATQVLESPTVNELHARLYRDAEDNFFLADQESIAGTWVNYAPITSGGTRLEHGDLIHIGKVLFRFEITDPARIPVAEIKVTDLEL